MSYNVLFPVSLLVAGDMSASITTNAIEVRNQDNIGVQLKWTGGPVGAFTFQVSIDHREDIQGNIITPGNWVSLPVSPGIAATGIGDIAYVDLTQTSAMYMRVVYTRTSGSGSLDITVAAKGI